jgi:tRNA 5-methylaminomethyl-2-thiouridine biosynthesis bifunctional protein
MSTNYEPLIPAAVVSDGRGVPYSLAYNDVYHPEWGADEQARRVFLHGNGLPGRWQGKPSFTVCETGFGLGQNFLALWQAWRSDPQRPARLHVVSFEGHPFTQDDLRRYLLHGRPGSEFDLAGQLVAAWPPLLPGIHRLEFEEGQVTLTLAFGAIERLARQVSASVDAYFLDGFAPRVNPAMWTASLFGQMARMANAGATLATWCCAGDVRRGLATAGFLVSKMPGYGGKREITVGTLRPGMGKTPAPASPRKSMLIVGGGLAGAGIAYALAMRGHQATVLDPVFVHGRSASHRGHIAAALTPTISIDDDIRSRLSRAGVNRALHRWQPLAGAARPLRCGTIELVGGDPLEVERRRHALQSLAFPSSWVRWVDARQASQLSGLALENGGLYFTDGQCVRPEPLLDALLSHHNISCVAARVHCLKSVGHNEWLAMGADGQPLAEAGEIVLANAGQAVELLANVPDLASLPKLQAMFQLAGQVSYFPEHAAPVARTLLAGDGYWLPPIVGSCVAGSTYVLNAQCSGVTELGHGEVRKKVAALLNVVPSELGRRLGPGDGWAGWRAAVADRLPEIGRIDGAAGLWLACAYGSRGLSWSALAGDVIAATIDNEPLPLERELLHKIAPR